MIKYIPSQPTYNTNGKVLHYSSTLVIVESFDELKELCLKHTPTTKTSSYNFHYGTKGSAKDVWSQVLECFKAIESGCPAKTVDEINHKSDEIAQAVINMDASLGFNQIWGRTEISDVWCAAAIAEGIDDPCFKKKDDFTQPSFGRGDGSYRIIINTDHTTSIEPTQGAITMGAILKVLSQIAPVEVWIQQGWLGSDPKDGITLFPIARGVINPATLWFWLGDSRKDFLFSRLVNAELFGRRSSGVSHYPAIESDLMMSSMHIGNGRFNSDDVEKYVQGVCRKIFYPDELAIKD